MLSRADESPDKEMSSTFNNELLAVYECGSIRNDTLKRVSSIYSNK